LSNRKSLKNARPGNPAREFSRPQAFTRPRCKLHEEKLLGFRMADRVEHGELLAQPGHLNRD
jgi:hypothetical protein